jgi:hypothetical protein
MSNKKVILCTHWWGSGRFYEGNMKRLENKGAIVIGGSKALGEAFCLANGGIQRKRRNKWKTPERSKKRRERMH